MISARQHPDRPIRDGRHSIIELVLVLAWVAPAALMIMFGWLGLPALAVTVPVAYLLTRPRACNAT